jgi:hypothetical protein
MGDESDGKFDSAMLMHILGVAKKGGMGNGVVEELLEVVREQHKIDKEAIKLQTAAYVNPPYDLTSLQNQLGTNPCREVALDTETCGLGAVEKDSGRTGWKADGTWDCFIEYEASGGKHVTDACQEAQKIADEEEVPVRLNFNDTRCLLYPNGKWEEACESWWEARNLLEKARKQSKISNFGMAPMNFVTTYVQDDEAAKMKMHVLKNRTVAPTDPDHFFNGLDDLIGED